jgi:hypothetical protein
MAIKAATALRVTAQSNRGSRMRAMPEVGKKYPANTTDPSTKPIMGNTGDLISIPEA